MANNEVCPTGFERIKGKCTLRIPNDGTPIRIGPNVTVEFDPTLPHEGLALPRGKIKLGKKFCEYTETIQEAAKKILIHEIGHELEGSSTDIFHDDNGNFSREYALMFDNVYPYKSNLFEGFADSFMRFIAEEENDNPTYLGTYISPQIRERMKTIQSVHPEYFDLAKNVLNGKIECV